jgi:hypothetical protein
MAEEAKIMAYVAGSKAVASEFAYPNGSDQTLRNEVIRGTLALAGTDYVPGGAGSSSFHVSAISTAGVATYAALVGEPLVNGQVVTLFGLTNNSGVYQISAVEATTFQLAAILTSGAFVPLTLPLTADASDAFANGAGQINWAVDCPSLSSNAQPVQVRLFSNSGSGYAYAYNALQQTVQVFVNDSGGDPSDELGAGSLISLPAGVSGDSIQFEAYGRSPKLRLALLWDDPVQ